MTGGLRRGLACALVVLAVLGGSYGALVSFRQDAQLSVGSIRLSVSPGHRGALDLYVPLVDWGARFEAIRLPVRLRVDVRTVDRSVVTRVAQGAGVDVNLLRDEARDAIARYLRGLVGAVIGLGASLGILVALAVRNRSGPKLRYTIGTALAAALAVGAAVALLLPPRGKIEQPQYYAYGPDIPRALRAVVAATRSTKALDGELNAQLVGLARLVVAPGEREGIVGFPRVVVASDLHNNVLALPVLERAADGAPVLFAGDATDRGTALEASLTRRLARAGKPLVFATGNHDSDTLTRRLARDGAIVLTQTGRLRPGGKKGPVVANVAGLRIAGYSDPYERRTAEDFRDRYNRTPSPEHQEAFTQWLLGLIGKVDVVLVHEPTLIAPALDVLRENPPAEPLVFAVGHTHEGDLQRFGNVTVLNGGSIGGGGTGNLAENTKIGLGVLVYGRRKAFKPLAADLVSIDPGTGSSTARRERLDKPAPSEAE